MAKVAASAPYLFRSLPVHSRKNNIFDIPHALFCIPFWEMQPGDPGVKSSGLYLLGKNNCNESTRPNKVLVITLKFSGISFGISGEMTITLKDKIEKKDPVNETHEQREFLFEKAVRFFHKYKNQLNQIRELLDIRLNQLALAYTTGNRLPCESVTIKTRVKGLDSFLKKLEKLKLDDFHFPSKIVYDLIGARVTCWFLDDCKGMMDYILKSNFIEVAPEGVFNYIDHPKPSGYRSIHLHGKISFENISSENGVVQLQPDKIICEIQVRTKLMDTWADLTHEFHYKAQNFGVTDTHLEKVLAAQAQRFFSEDESFLAIRDMYQKMIEKNE